MYELAIGSVEVQWTTGWKKNVDESNIAAAVGRGVRDVSHKMAPEDTGALKRSLRWDTDSNSTEVSANTYYALYVEKGTSKMAAQPYLQPAMKPGAEQALRTYKPGTKYAKKAGKTLTAKEIQAKGRSTAVRDHDRDRAQSAMQKQRAARQRQAQALQNAKPLNNDRNRRGRR